MCHDKNLLITLFGSCWAVNFYSGQSQVINEESYFLGNEILI